MTAAEQIAKALHAKELPAGGWSGQCPAHDDTHPSLSIAEGAKGPLVHCHAGCDQGAVIDALKDRGLWPEHDDSDIPLAHGQLGRYEQNWDYHDAGGVHVLRVCRWDINGKKEIRPLSFQAGAWSWKQLADYRPLYQLPALLADKTRRVLLVEGEKTADAARKYFPDLIVTTWAGGAKAASKTDWSPLAGRDVTLVPDHDEPGRKAMDIITNILRSYGCTVRRADLSPLGELPEGWDVADALGDRDFDLDALAQVVEGAAVTSSATATLNGGDDITCAATTIPGATPKITLRHIADILAEQRKPRWLIRKILEMCVLAVLAGPRGTFKSFIALHWAMLIALSGRCVVILSAEGAGLDRRVDAWMRVHGSGKELRALRVFAIERQFNLNSAETLGELREMFAAAGVRPDLIVIDTYSKYAPGLDENDNAAVAMFLATISNALRDEYAATVLLVAHAGHGDAKRPRGAYVLMANPDAEYIVERPNPKGMTVTVSRDRFKDSESLSPLAYEARSVDLGRVDDDGDPVTSLVLSDVGAPPVEKPKAAGTNQQAAVVALREWTRSNVGATHISTMDISALLKRQGIGAKRKPEVLNWLVNAGIITTTAVGGYTLHPEVL